MGKPKTPEHRAKISAALRGRTKTPEQRAALRGIAKSPEHRAKLSAAKRGKLRISPEDWTPRHSVYSVANAVRRGMMPPPSQCVNDHTHQGPYQYDHFGDPPYAPENRYVVQPLCVPCHVSISTSRRNGTGYINRRVTQLKTCAYCGKDFPVPQKQRLIQDRVFCCWEHYLLGR